MERLLNVSQTSIAQALAADYFCIYYVDTESDKFVEYSASPEFKSLGLPDAGDDFISFSRERFEKLVHEEDRKFFLDTFTKENIVRSLNAHGYFTMTFRLLMEGVPTYVHMKVTRMIEKEVRHAVIGISSVDEQMRQQAELRQAEAQRLTYSRVAQALAGDFFSIYVVDLDTDHFHVYSSTQEFDTLKVEKSGEDFFLQGAINGKNAVHPEDLPRFLERFTREKVMEEIRKNGVFKLQYRLLLGGKAKKVTLKIAPFTTGGEEKLFAGVRAWRDRW